MPKSKQMVKKAKKINTQKKAYNELLKMAKEETFVGCVAGGRRENLLRPLIDPPDYYGDSFVSRLNHVLDNLAVGGTLHTDVNRHVVRLLLDAGANPNYTHYDNFYGDGAIAIFDRFVQNSRYDGAVEIAKTEGFVGPENQAKVYKQILSYSLCPSKCELVEVLFDLGMYPYNPNVRKILQPIYEAQKKAKANAPKPAGNAPQGGRSGANR